MLFALPPLVKVWQDETNAAELVDALHIAAVYPLQFVVEIPSAVAMAIQQAGSLAQALQSAAAAPPAPPVALVPPVPVEPPVALVPPVPVEPPVPPELVLLPQPWDAKTTVMNATATTLLKPDHILLDMLDSLPG
jgi:hypothetical protein